MRPILFLLLAAAGSAVLAPAALGSTAAVTAVELSPASTHRSPAASREAKRFTLVGLHWRGSGRVLFRTRSEDGRWSTWHQAAPEAEDGPDPASPEARARAGWRVGSPWWAGPSDRIETRALGKVSRIRAFLVWSPELRVPYRTPAATVAPPIMPRSSWGANESIRKGPPSYAPDVRFAVVHHTAGRNDYSRAESPAVVKAIQLYHVQGNGWNDIGYNFLVDRFGTIYEGRYGGIDRNVIGAHALGFNTGSVGVALLGTYGSTSPSKPAQDALARLLAWRLDLAHVDPTGFTTVISGGSERHASGLPVLLRSVSGHRDTGFTECPGDLLFGRLDALAVAANGIGLPKLYEPQVETKARTARFRARLSGSLSWTVTIADPAGLEVAQGADAGAAVDWTWDATDVPAGRYSWTIRAGGARPAKGTLTVGGAPPPPAIDGVALEPEAISPNGDGQADSAVLSYRLTAAMNVTVDVRDTLGGILATLVDRVWSSAGSHTVAVDGAGLADGSYHVVLTARTAAGGEVQQVVPLTVSRTLGAVVIDPAVFSPNGDGRRDQLRVTFSLATPAEVKVRILRDGRWVASPLTSGLPPGAHEVTWNGMRGTGPVRDGSYTAVVEASDAAGTISFGAPFVSDVSAPRVRMLPERRLRLRVDEPVRLVLHVDGARLEREVRRPGVVWIRGTRDASRIRVVAWDEAGNRSTELVRLRKKARSGSRQ